ncbi:MAG TPA: hypothetical protein DEP45_05065 [Armatimonadetes bacterium]|nr:hypothetical protein [Armatimonadota bacterium]
MRMLLIVAVLGLSACAQERPAEVAAQEQVEVVAPAAQPQVQPASDPAQVPLCMIGDSITWAQEGDWWRRYLIEEIPTLAFVGTHVGKFGYSHAGEGGNRTSQVLARMEEIPDCANYHLMIGINDSASATSQEQVDTVAAGTAERIVQIVEGLLAKPSCEHVFLASILPGWQEEKPFRDVAGSRTNELLREQLGRGVLADERVVWVEYEKQIRPMEGWQQLMRIHPTIEGYGIVAGITADAIREELGLPEDLVAPVPAPGAGVRVMNLWEGGAGGQTNWPLIAGWYTLSFDVGDVDQAGGHGGPSQRRRGGEAT